MAHGTSVLKSRLPCARPTALGLGLPGEDVHTLPPHNLETLGQSPRLLNMLSFKRLWNRSRALNLEANQLAGGVGPVPKRKGI